MSDYKPLVDMTDHDQFVKRWVEATVNMSPEQIAFEVWRLANLQYGRGFDQGQNDPYFTDGDEQ